MGTAPSSHDAPRRPREPRPGLRRLGRHLPAALIWLVLGACGAGGSPPMLPPPPTAPPSGTAEACPLWRWIGVKVHTTAPCPPPPSGSLWTVQPLFSSGSGLPPGLLPFCLYEHPGAGDPSTILSMVPAQLTAAARDCAVVTPAATEMENLLRPVLSQRFLEQTGRVSWSVNADPVRLTLLDTSPTAEVEAADAIANSAHGTTLANLGSDLLCEEGACLATVASQLAMPIVRFQPDNAAASGVDLVRGGYLGTLGQLATALWAEVESWQASGEEHLVLNLSLGWDGARFGGNEGETTLLNPPVAAVYRAIEQAVCRGALVVAAAGNASGAGQDLGPLHPAAWEALPAPDAKTCQAVLGLQGPPAKGPRPLRLSEQAYRPLVYAAGGVDGGGYPLRHARALPRLTAFADHAATPVADSAVTTTTLTGSSVATLVVSSAAAAVWHYRPDLDGHQVMAMLYDSAPPQGGAAEFYLETGTPAPESRRVLLCRAVGQACTPELGTCPPPLGCPSTGPDLLSLPEPLLTQLLEIAGPLHDASNVQEKVFLPPPCTDKHLVYADPPGPPTDPCPVDQYPTESSEPWTDPQPGSNPCPNCQMFPDWGRVNLEIDPAFTGILTNPILHLGGVSIALPVGPLQAGDAVKIENLDLNSYAKNGPAPSLSFTVDGLFSAASELLVVD